mmetsp:Transcript_21211/g.29734  ORF Transcript_21211/g.29734 Transcript_21211/m.29734 type:complete len:103 (+) Transcript_21211:52-360(+)
MSAFLHLLMEFGETEESLKPLGDALDTAGKRFYAQTNKPVCPSVPKRKRKGYKGSLSRRSRNGNCPRNTDAAKIKQPTKHVQESKSRGKLKTQLEEAMANQK